MNCEDIINKIGYNKNIKKFVSFKNGILIISIPNEFFDPYSIRHILSCIEYVHNTYKSKLLICFDFQEIKLMDKLSYVVFECICKSLIENFGHTIAIQGKFTSNISTEGIISSPLQYLSEIRTKKIDLNKSFIKGFNLDIYRCHYRKVCNHNEYHSNPNKLSVLYDDICSFQKGLNINYDCIEDISEVIVELVGNAIEHSGADCLLDIDIAPNYQKENCNEKFCGINIAVLNISDILLGDGVRNKIKTNIFENTNDNRYNKILEAFDYHKEYFSDEYTEEDFFNITAFQDKISGRLDNYVTGGTGLTLLIKSIQERADMHTCYVHTGNRLLLLNPNLLEYDDNRWLGFNKEKDYFKHIPDKEIIDKSHIYIPGTAYNLNFVMKVNNDE